MATSNNNININLNAKDNASPAIKKVNMNLREMGERIQSLGMMATMAFTAPIVGGFALAVKSSKELQTALEPIKTAFGEVGKELGTALLPLVKEITPGLIELSKTLTGIIKGFEALPEGQKKAIVGFILFVAAIGPTLVIIGNVIKAVGTISMLLGGLPAFAAPAAGGILAIGKAAAAALGPFGLLLIAVTALIELLNSDFGKSGITALGQVLAMAAGGSVLLTTGNKKMADEAFKAASINLGLIGNAPAQAVRPASTDMAQTALSQFYGNPNRSTLVFNYSPGISTASQYEAQQQLKPMIEQILRQTNGR